MPRAFLVKHKRARVDSIADGLLAQHENVDAPDIDSRPYGRKYERELDLQDSLTIDVNSGHKLDFAKVDAVSDTDAMDAMMGRRGEGYSLETHHRYPAPPPLLLRTSSSGSAFKKVHPGQLPLDLQNIPMGMYPAAASGGGGPQHQVVWLDQAGAPGHHNILRDRLLSHPASAAAAYLMSADPKRVMLPHRLHQAMFQPQPEDEPLDLKVKGRRDVDSERDSYELGNRGTKRSKIAKYQLGDAMSFQKHAGQVPLDFPRGLVGHEALRNYPHLSAAHPSMYPFLGLPYNPVLMQEHMASLAYRMREDRKCPDGFKTHSPVKGEERMSPPLLSSKDRHSALFADLTQPPICSVKPTFSVHSEGNSSPSSPSGSHGNQTLLSPPGLSPHGDPTEDDMDQDSREGSPSPLGAKRPTRQPVLGLEYIQNGMDHRDDRQLGPEAAADGSDQHHLLRIPSPERHYHMTRNDASLIPADQNGRSRGSGLATDPKANAAGIPVAPHQFGEPKRRANSAKTPQPRKYICDVCGKGFSRSNTLVTHKRIHTGDKPFACELCGRAFRQPGNLTRHRLTHTTVKPYVCNQCGKAFNRASNLHTHMRTHTNYKPFVCQYCGKGFHQKIDMKIHSYTHTGEKPHKCQKCGRGFKQLTHLTYHMRTHSEVKMYSCAYCGKGFNQKGNLQAHIYRHTGERPYRCEVCNKGFTLASTLNTHRRTHAEKKPFACQYCGKDFYQKNALKSHLLASHPYTDGESLL